MRNRRLWYAAAVLFVLLALPTLCAGQPAGPTASSDEPLQDVVVQLAQNDASTTPAAPASKVGGMISSACDLATRFLGTPYRWGGTTPRAFDCSGFVRYIYNKLGVSLPRTARQQCTKGQKVAYAGLQAGDLIFFDMMKGYVSHVGMYLGGGKFIHASNPRSGVRIDSIDRYRKHFVSARRFIS